MDPLHNELKRVSARTDDPFSDAVFAIAITLLVIEIKVPELEQEHLTEGALLKSLEHLFPKIIGFLISFFLIGNYWMVHHRLFGFVIDYNRKLLWMNLLFYCLSY
ncbi:TMEM175 family protein [Paraflavitalea speifideaquila]|uniref:TMEM175 family protein n=1 Tax=Paraflavitalea speifideaquila TaxID=3076558 RepID=UPI0028E77175|nr:TMEM175 family protein [Paraflavitalea speifideiaquila]